MDKGTKEEDVEKKAGGEDVTGGSELALGEEKEAEGREREDDEGDVEKEGKGEERKKGEGEEETGVCLACTSLTPVAYTDHSEVCGKGVPINALLVSSS